ncbi:MAG: Fur family transcriptional regulator [Bacteroidia bacterium]
MNQLDNILARHKLRRTAPRQAVLELFIKESAALSQPELEHKLKTQCDRVTIYRTLTAFLENGIVHKVLDDAGAAKYALCAHDCESDHVHQHNHIHFKCENCGQTTCLDDVRVPPFNLPDGYKVRETNVLLQGVCGVCK